jgi:small multidrug resistance pump
MHYLFLAVAILAEVVATSSLKASAQFTKLGPSLIVLAGYGTAFYCLTHALKAIPVGICYAVWSGVGMVLIAGVAAALYGQRVDWPAALGMGLIVAGVLVINLWSKMEVHS